MISNPTIDIVIVNYRSAADTLNALSRLGSWRHGVIWVVDNSAHEPVMIAETASLLDAVADTPSARLLSPRENIGFGRACNLAFEQSKADFFLLLNPDACIAGQDVLHLVESLESDSKLAAVSPMMYWNAERSFVLPVATPQTPWQSVVSAMTTRSRFLARWVARVRIGACIRQTTTKNLIEVDFLAGAVLLLRRQAVLAAGGLFDPIYFMFFEDSDLSLRLGRHGYKLAVLPTVSAVHEYRHKAYKAGLMAQSQLQYFRKNYPKFFLWSKELQRISFLAKAQVLGDWFWTLPEPIASAEEFRRLTGGRSVIAFSPSTMMVPSACRPSFSSGCGFSDGEWALLEPSPYVALIKSVTDSEPPIWVYFTRA